MRLNHSFQLLGATVLFFYFAFMNASWAEVPVQQKLMAKRAAELDAYRLLGERILGLQVSSESIVKDFAAESDEVATSLDDFIKAVRFKDTRYFDDGSVEVDAEVTVRSVVETINRSLEKVKSSKPSKNSNIDVSEVERLTKDSLIQITGAGAVRPETRMPDPQSIPIVSVDMGASAKSISLPAIYRKVGAAERLKAKRAAEVDAYRKLIERVEGLKIGAQTQVKDFVTESDQIKTGFTQRLQGARTVGVRYMPDGVVEVQMEITVPLLVTELQRMCKASYNGKKWTEEGFEKIKEYTDRKVIAVVGVGTVDRRGLEQPDSAKQISDSVAKPGQGMEEQGTIVLQ